MFGLGLLNSQLTVFPPFRYGWHTVRGLSMARCMQAALASGLIFLALPSAASAQTCPPPNLTNGTTADANGVMAWLNCKAPISSPLFSGTVGIGVGSTARTFDVNSGSSSATARFSSGDTVYGPIVDLQSFGGLGDTLRYLNAAGTGGWTTGYSQASGNFVFSTGVFAAPAETSAVLALTQSGNVGIANISPLSQLQVGPGTSNGGSPVAMFGAPASNAAVNVLSLVNSAVTAIGNEADMSFHLSSNYLATARIGAVLTGTTATDLLFSTYNTGLSERMRITSTGSVGIGNVSPLAILQVGPGASNGSSVTMFGGSAAGAAVNVLSLVNSTAAATGNEADLSFNLSNGTSATALVGAVLTSATNADLLFSTYAGGLAERMRITSGGNVGIGTSTPASRLTLSGPISASSWSTSGLELSVGADTLTDTTSSGSTISTRVASSFGIPTFAASNPVTLTEGATFYIGGPPVAGSNVTFATVPLNANHFDLIANSTASAAETFPILIRNASTAANSAAALAFSITNAAGAVTATISDTRVSGSSHSLIFSTWNGALFEAMRITGQGNVGIGTATPAHALDVVGSIQLSGLGSASATPLCYSGSGPYLLSSCSSSIRYKEQVQSASFGLKEVLRMRPVTFKWKGRDENDFGFIAEEMAKIDPRFVTHKDGRIEGVKYPQLTAVLVNAVKELRADNQRQALEIKALTAQASEVENLRAEVVSLAKAIRRAPSEKRDVRLTTGAEPGLVKATLN